MLPDKLTAKTLFKQQAYINGNWVDASEQLSVISPATEEPIGVIPSLSREQVREAIEAAKNSFDEWRGYSSDQRAEILDSWYRLIFVFSKDLKLIAASESGKPQAEVLAEVDYAASFVKFFSEEAIRIHGTILAGKKSGQKINVQYEPIGPVAMITPWNFPLSMVTRKVAPALASGSTIVLKPSELTPYSALALAYLAEMAGVPAGVFNVVTGDAKVIGEELTANNTIRKLSFTGSTSVGKLLMKQSAGTLKRLSMELGGNAPLIIFEDADLELAITGLMHGKFRNNGQSCIGVNRVLVHSSLYDQVANLLKDAISKLKTGNDLVEEGVQLGPLISKAALDKMTNFVAAAKQQGAKVGLGGKTINRKGFFFEPTLITGATHEMLIARQEIFGPVCVLYQFDSENEAIHMANSTDYGLAAYVYSQNLERAERVADKLEFGMIGINETAISSEKLPFGGIKHSGFGREGSFLGMREYLNTKSVIVK
jgi:succinate-semialdehyde dehydrogenase/glutarate-semialdehyde dehydrogenase